MSKKEISNSLWMMSEKIISIFGLIFVTSFVAKYVGPGVFGEIALATTLFQIVQVIAQLGCDVIIFKRVSKNSTSGINLIHSTIGIRVIVYTLTSIPIILFFMMKNESSIIFYLLSACIACFFSTLDVYASYFDAKLQSKKNTLINIYGLIISLIIRWLIAYLELSPVTLCMPIILTSFIPYIIRKIYFHKESENFSITKRQKGKYTRYLFKAGINLVVSSLSVAIYPRLAIIILGFYTDSFQVGLLSVAATLAGSWAFVCNSIITSFLPSIFSEKDTDKALLKASKLNILVILIILPILILIILCGKFFITLFYGANYLQSYTYWIILSFSTAISLLGTISARFIVKFSGYTFLSKKMLVVTLISLILNLFLINEYGALGAAIATLLTEILSLTFLNYFYNNFLIGRLHITTLKMKPFLKKLR